MPIILHLYLENQQCRWIYNTFFLIIHYRRNILRSLTSYLCFSPVSFTFFNLSKAADRPPLSLFSLRDRDFANPCSTTKQMFLFSYPTWKSIHIYRKHSKKNRDRYHWDGLLIFEVSISHIKKIIKLINLQTLHIILIVCSVVLFRCWRHFCIMARTDRWRFY